MTLADPMHPLLANLSAFGFLEVLRPDTWVDRKTHFWKVQGVMSQTWPYGIKALYVKFELDIIRCKDGHKFVEVLEIQ